MRISDWSSDVCSTDLQAQEDAPQRALAAAAFADQAERLAAPDGQVDAVGRLHQDARIAGHAAPEAAPRVVVLDQRSEEHTSELQSLMRISYAVFCLKKKTKRNKQAKHNARIIIHYNNILET